MNDLRPSEDTDRLELPEMRRLGFFKDLPTGDGFFTEPAAGESDEPWYEGLTEDEWVSGMQENVDRYGGATAIALAITDVARQLRIANLIAFEQVTGVTNRAEIRKGLGL